MKDKNNQIEEVKTIYKCASDYSISVCGCCNFWCNKKGKQTNNKIQEKKKEKKTI